MVARFLLTAAAPLLLIACGTLRAPGTEMFDEQTGNTVTMSTRPLVFARERTDVAAHARDYATVVAVEVDHSGAFQDFLLVYRWSTVDKRMAPLPGPGGGDMRFLSEGRVVSLKPLDDLPFDVGTRARQYLPRHGDYVVRAFAVDPDLLRFLAASRTLTLQLPQESVDAPFQIWEDGRAALAEFVRQTSAP